MSLTSPIIVKEIQVGLPNGANLNTYSFPVPESVQFEVTDVEEVVGPGRKLVHARDIATEVKIYDDGILADPHLTKDTDDTPQLAMIRFIGASGSQNVNVGGADGTYIYARPTHDGDRKGYLLQLSERVTNVEAFLLKN